MTTLSRLLVLNASCLLLTACGHIQKNITSTETLLDKAKFATGISAEKLKIVDGSIRSEMDSLHYKVKAPNGTVYRCYFTTVVATSSDALCSAIDSTGKGKQKQKKQDADDSRCNAQLRAAGKC